MRGLVVLCLSAARGDAELSERERFCFGDDALMRDCCCTPRRVGMEQCRSSGQDPATCWGYDAVRQFDHPRNPRD